TAWRVVAVEPLQGMCLRVKFIDGTSGEVRLQRFLESSRTARSSSRSVTRTSFGRSACSWARWCGLPAPIWLRIPCTTRSTHGDIGSSARSRSFMRYKIALLKTDEGYGVSVPGLPGCWSQDATEEEALQNILAVIQEYLAARDELLDGAVVREFEVTL